MFVNLLGMAFMQQMSPARVISVVAPNYEYDQVCELHRGNYSRRRSFGPLVHLEGFLLGRNLK